MNRQSTKSWSLCGTSNCDMMIKLHISGYPVYNTSLDIGVRTVKWELEPTALGIFLREIKGIEVMLNIGDTLQAKTCRSSINISDIQEIPSPRTALSMNSWQAGPHPSRSGINFTINFSWLSGRCIWPIDIHQRISRHLNMTYPDLWTFMKIH